MATQNSNATAAGTTGGGNTLVTNGNPYLEGMATLTNVLSDIGSQYSSFLDARLARKIAAQQAVAPPAVNSAQPLININTPAGTQSLFLSIGMIALLSVGGVLIFKSFK
jgi:hypothetical protein